ncbi:MAG: hypothetical protein ACREA2_15255 [Blastocatellia bacterium]
MKNLIKKIATSLGLTLMVASLVVISPNQAQAKGKKKAGNSAKAKSQSSRGLHLPEVILEVQVPRQTAVSNGSANLQNAENLPSSIRRKNRAGAEGFSIDMGTSENINSNTEGARRKATKRARQ